MCALLKRDMSIINDEDDASNTPLHLAALCGNDKVAKELLDRGAAIDARSVKTNATIVGSFFFPITSKNTHSCVFPRVMGELERVLRCLAEVPGECEALLRCPLFPLMSSAHRVALTDCQIDRCLIDFYIISLIQMCDLFLDSVAQFLERSCTEESVGENI